MGKYFKEEETSNRIKRFKTSDTQEKTLRFAQLSRVVTIFDKFLESSKIFFQTAIKTSKLIKVNENVLLKLKDEFDAITRVQKAVATSKLSEISKLEEEIKKLSEQWKLLLKDLDLKKGAQYNNDLEEIEKIKKIVDAKYSELQKLKLDLSKIEKAAEAEIEAKILEFNQNNKMVTQLSWNRDFADPKMDFLLPTGLSMKGLKEGLFRMRPGKSFSEVGFLNFTRRNTTVALNAYQVKKLEDELKSIGFYKDEFTFIIKNGNEWKPQNITLYKFLENLASGTYKSGQIVIKDEAERKKLQTAYTNFETKLDEVEKGWPLHPFFRTVAVVLGGLATIKTLNMLGISVNPLPVLATLPLRFKKRQELNDPNKRKQDITQARKDLSLSAQEDKTIKELQDILPSLPPGKVRDAVIQQIESLQVIRNNGR